MDNKGFEILVAEYERTAKILSSRIKKLKSERALYPFDMTLRLEERIAILEAEYTHLIKTATYMRENYTESKKLDITA